ncbi:MAG: VCBS repeat-containing protein [Bacteroidia bacterium]|nr:VCBS repeat-containing protein [Bacteroidia bacterium]
MINFISLRLASFAFSVVSALMSLPAFAQTPGIKWWYDTQDASFGQSAAGDIDGDGMLEIVFGCYRNDSCVYALNGNDGTLLWKYNTHPPNAEGCNDVAPVIFDVDGDGSLEVIVPSSCNPVTFCFNGPNGTVQWQCSTRGSDSPPTIADVDNDTKPEILHGEFGGYVKCINAENGTQAWELPVDLNSWIQTAPTLADLDNNGQIDFVVGTWNFNGLDSIYAYRGDNQLLLWSYPVHDYMYHGTAVTDLDNDGKPELLIGSYNDTLYCINGENGTTAWKYKASGGYIGSPATVADLDNDGICEVIFASSYQVTALTASGTLKWQYNNPGFEQSFRGVAISDITNDAYPDVIFGTDGGKVRALNGNNGSLIWTVDLAAHYGDPDFELDHAPLVADFDGDDTLDVFIVGGHAEYPNFQNDFGRAYLISAGKGNGPDWLMFQRDVYRQSSLCTYSSVGVQESAGSPPLTVFPNPFSGSANIVLASPVTHAELNVYDLNGQRVKHLAGISGQSIVLERSDLPAGMYFLHLTENEKLVGTVKLIVAN